MKANSFLIVVLIFGQYACGKKQESTSPQISDITESVYSSGIVVSKDQYSLYARVSGVVKEIMVEVGDTIHKGDTLLLIENKAQQINNENAQLSERFYSVNNNKDQLANLENSIRVAKQKKEFDSLQYVRQKKLFEDGVGVEVDLEISKLSYENSVINYHTAVNQLSEFKRQLNFNSSQARNNVRISSVSKSEFILLSEIDGLIYGLDCSVGELVSPQRPLGMIGSARQFILEMLIDESDIMDVHVGQEVVVTLDSYENEVFEAFVTKIYPLMDLTSKSFKIEAEFVDPPAVLYPNMNFEANIIINSKEDVLLVPREYLIDEKYVLLENGDTIKVETGLKDYQMIEVLSGISESDRIILPEE
jgi:HlyD family secretion protein